MEQEEASLYNLVSRSRTAASGVQCCRKLSGVPKLVRRSQIPQTHQLETTQKLSHTKIPAPNAPSAKLEREKVNVPNIPNESTHKQTGPKTPEGKSRSSQNASLHGGTSRKLIIEGESLSDFEALLNGLLLECEPETEQARQLVEDAALSRWFLWRRQRAYNAIESALYAAQPDEAKWSEEQSKRLSVADRYKIAAERAFQRAFNGVDTLRKNRVAQERWQATHALNERRLAMQEEKLAMQKADHACKARKTAAEDALAIAKASDELKDREEKKWRQACRGFDRPTAIQHVTVNIVKGQTITTKTPSNDAIHRQLKQPGYPPQAVCRKFQFPEGMPPEYHHFTGNETYRLEKNHAMEQNIDVSTWLEIAEEEARLGTEHAVLGRQLYEVAH